MVKRVIVGAHYGLRDWLAQRVTAVVMAIYTLIFVLLLFGSRPITYTSWKALFAQGWIRFATFLFIASVLIHAWIGMRDIWMDYIGRTGLRLVLEVATILLLVGCAGWSMQILWRA